MWILLGAIAIAIFLFGLVQWAYSGAGLWSVWSLKKGLRFASRREWAEKEDEIRRTEKRTDQLLMSSFKVIGILAVVMWLFLGVTVLLDLLGIDWVSRISARAQTFWGSPAYNSAPVNTQSPARRSDIMKSLRDSLGK